MQEETLDLVFIWDEALSTAKTQIQDSANSSLALQEQNNTCPCFPPHP
jgi:hypothetical protein